MARALIRRWLLWPLCLGVLVAALPAIHAVSRPPGAVAFVNPVPDLVSHQRRTDTWPSHPSGT